MLVLNSRDDMQHIAAFFGLELSGGFTASTFLYVDCLAETTTG